VSRLVDYRYVTGGGEHHHELRFWKRASNGHYAVSLGLHRFLGAHYISIEYWHRGIGRWALGKNHKQQIRITKQKAVFWHVVRYPRVTTMVEAGWRTLPPAKKGRRITA